MHGYTKRHIYGYRKRKISILEIWRLKSSGQSILLELLKGNSESKIRISKYQQLRSETAEGLDI
jgi:hypothetical protein